MWDLEPDSYADIARDADTLSSYVIERARPGSIVLLHVMFPGYRVHGYTAGGLTGELVGEVSLGLFHHAGTYLVALAVMCVGMYHTTMKRSCLVCEAAKVVFTATVPAGS